jgi:APA family basic amino acid/polyamine antiporter
VCTLLVFRRRGTPVPVKTPLYPVTPLIFVLQVVALLAAILTSTPWQALLGCAVVLLGLPVYTFLQREHVVPAENGLPVSENATER